MPQIDGCRVCKGARLETVLDLGMMVNCGTFPRTVEEDLPATPLVLARCLDCGLAQLLHDTDPAETFGQGFGYRSSTNVSMRIHLEDIAKRVYGFADFRPRDTVVDIGSNDGFFLSCLPNSLERIGVDPTIPNHADLYDKSIVQIPEFFDMDVARRIGKGRAKAVTTIAMFYDLPDPNAFIEAVKYILAEDGVWFLEQAYLPRMLELGAFDVICHEHLEYYDTDSLSRLLSRHGLEIIASNVNETNGGSAIYAVRKRADGAGANYTSGAIQSRDFVAFQEKIADSLQNTLLFFTQERLFGRSAIHGLGASTKFNTVLQYFNIGKDVITAIADPNPDKWGRLTPGTHIPIISEAESRVMAPDFYVVGPWHFRDSIIERERAFLERGGKLVFLLPEFEVVGAGALT